VFVGSIVVYSFHIADVNTQNRLEWAAKFGSNASIGPAQF
jgi:hypothetical protein